MLRTYWCIYHYWSCWNYRQSMHEICWMPNEDDGSFFVCNSADLLLTLPQRLLIAHEFTFPNIPWSPKSIHICGNGNNFCDHCVNSEAVPGESNGQNTLTTRLHVFTWSDTNAHPFNFFRYTVYVATFNRIVHFMNSTDLNNNGNNVTSELTYLFFSMSKRKINNNNNK